MEPILPVGNDTPTSALGLSNTGDATMGQEDFLQLLVTQLSNQDPLNPMDGQEFAAQLAQFSSLEQLLNINTSLAQNGEINGLLAQSINSGVAAGLIGKEIEAEGNAFRFSAEENTKLRYELADGASNVSLEIRNEAGNVVHTVDLGAQLEGDQEYRWDGKDEAGNVVPDGAYSFSVTAKDAEGNSIDNRTFIRGQVDRVSFGGGGILLWIGDTSIAMGDVSSVRE